MSEVNYQPVPFNPKAFAARKGKESPSFKVEYEVLEDEFATLAALLHARQAAALTQAEVATRMGISKSRLAQIEASLGHQKNSPSLATLRRYAEACGKKLLIQIV